MREKLAARVFLSLSRYLTHPTALRPDAVHLSRKRDKTLREFYLAIATLAAHEYFAFGCGSLFA